jgi:hypothetical protein
VTPTAPIRRVVNVVEINPFAPRPFVFTEVAMCLRDSIRAAGHESSHLVNEFDPQAVSIVLGASPDTLPESLRQLDPRRTILFNFEQLGSTSAMAGPNYRRWLRNWVVADYHSRNADLLRAENGPAQQVGLLPLVPSPRLVMAADSPALKSVDVLFFGTLSARREAVLQRLRDAGASVEVVSGAYANELTPAILRARLLLHVHFYESAYFPVARMLQPVAQGIAIVCEDSVFSAHDAWGRCGILFAGYDDLPAACQSLLAMPHDQQQRISHTLQFAARQDFAAPLERLLQALDTHAARVPQVASAPASALATADPDQALSNEEIEAILAEEAAQLPDANATPADLSVARREPGQGRFGQLIVWVLLAFMVVGLVMGMLTR